LDLTTAQKWAIIYTVVRCRVGLETTQATAADSRGVLAIQDAEHAMKTSNLSPHQITQIKEFARRWTTKAERKAWIATTFGCESQAVRDAAAALAKALNGGSDTRNRHYSTDGYDLHGLCLAYRRGARWYACDSNASGQTVGTKRECLDAIKEMERGESCAMAHDAEASGRGMTTLAEEIVCQATGGLPVHWDFEVSTELYAGLKPADLATIGRLLEQERRAAGRFKQVYAKWYNEADAGTGYTGDLDVFEASTVEVADLDGSECGDLLPGYRENVGADEVAKLYPKAIIIK
jgi:hypothetical protein